MATNGYLVLIPSATFGPARVALIPATARLPPGVHAGHGVTLLGAGPTSGILGVGPSSGLLAGAGVGGNSRPGRFVARAVSTLAQAGDDVAYLAVPPSTPAGAFRGGAAFLGSGLQCSNAPLIANSSRGAHVVTAAAARVPGEVSEDDDGFILVTPPVFAGDAALGAMTPAAVAGGAVRASAGSMEVAVGARCAHGRRAFLGCLKAGDGLIRSSTSLNALLVNSSRRRVVTAASAGAPGEASEDDDFTITTPIQVPVGEDKGEAETWPSHFQKLARRAVLLLQQSSDGSESFRWAQTCLGRVGIKGSKGLLEVDQVREATRALKLVYEHLVSGRPDSAPFPRIRDEVQASLILTKVGDEMQVSVINHEVLLTVLLEDMEQAVDAISKVV